MKFLLSIPKRAPGLLERTSRRMARRVVTLAEGVMIRASAVPRPGLLSWAVLSGAARGRLALLYRLEGRRGAVERWQGLEVNSAQPLRVAFIGDQRAWKTGSAAYLQHILFQPGSVQTTPSGDLAMSSAPRSAEALAAGTDLIIIERSRRFRWVPNQGDWRLTPTWVRMGIRFQPGEPWEVLEERMRGHKNNIRRFQKYGFQLRASRDVQDFDLFYDRMHAPMVTRRHGDYTELEPKAAMLENFRKHGLLLFASTPEGQTVAGKLLYHYGPLAYVYAAGTLDGEHRWHDLGALSALTWYEIRWAYENGVATLDCGSVRPFATDGNYLFKLRWGMRPIPDPWAARDWLIWVPNGNPAALGWLAAHPLIEAET